MTQKTHGRTFQSNALILLIASVSIWASDTYAAATVVGQTLLSAVRSGRTTFDYTYTVTLMNSAPALNSATINVTSSAPSTVVLKSVVSVPALAASTTTTTTDTFVIRQDRLVPFSWSSIVFTVIPGPGPVAQGQITAAVGGTISVTDPGDPLLGTKVVIPPGALGDPNDTITIGYSTTLPGALNANATAAGVVSVGLAGAPVITLTKLGATPFQADVMVTIPYSRSALGSGDVPVVDYWDPTLQQYQAVQVLSVDQINGFITVQTKHFSLYAPFGLPGLDDELSGKVAFSGPVLTIDTGFSPQFDGFEAENFATGLSAPPNLGNIADTNGGVCFGLTSYAAWYFTAKPSPTRLFAQYQTASDPGLAHVPQEDAIARELITKTYIDTVNDSGALVNAVANGEPVALTPPETIEQFLIQLLVTKSPQLAVLTTVPIPPQIPLALDPEELHSVLLYAFNVATLSFSVYDPNVPYPLQQPPPLSWSVLLGNFRPWTSAGRTYGVFEADAYGSHYDTQVLNDLFVSTQSGPPSDQFGSGYNFNTLTISSPLGSSGPNSYPGGQSDPILNVDPLNGTTLTFAWACDLCFASDPYYLHVFQNNVPMTPVPISNNSQVDVLTLSFSGNSAELFAFVSTIANAATDPDDQSDIADGYSGFQRAELGQPSVTITVSTVVPGWLGLPATIKVSGLYATTIAKFENLGDTKNSCFDSLAGAAPGERGNPLFSSFVDAGVAFDGATSITGMPREEAGPVINDNPCSSFIATERDANGNGKVWINATGRGESFGAFLEDWEYQLRYYSGDPANNYGDASCTLGTVPNDDSYSGTPVQCTVQCNTTQLGKLPSCSN
jgi:hypothetical protein